MLDRVKRRRWSASEKLEICDQARVPGVSVAQVARRYALNATMLHGWLKDSRFGGGHGSGKDVPHGGGGEVSGSAFYEVSVSSDPTPVRMNVEVPQSRVSGPAEARVSKGSLHALRVDLSLSDGRRVLIEGATNLAAILALVEGLSD